MTVHMLRQLTSRPSMSMSAVKRKSIALLFRLTADIDGTCVAATNNDGRQTGLFLVKNSGHDLLIYFFL